MHSEKEIRIAVFASGNGSNAQRIAEYFSAHQTIGVAVILCNKREAGVVQRALKLGIPCELFTAQELKECTPVAGMLKKHGVDFIVLAGFLLKIPSGLIDLYPFKIINIHPALLPAYGGKGMYGLSVHSAVIQAGETRSGISIHFVNEGYDEGNIIFQAFCPVLPDDNPETLAARIHELEYRFYPEMIEKVIAEMLQGKKI
jgi:phosphoribosylglycinamide formyltransferase-1